ncbi:EamA family transporter [Spirosoma soli]|uniref:EamA family transporter n=1 Tax=Spirosoma soli TaxID=1770529 RepID=A0ABW5M9L4_9BACT
MLTVIVSVTAIAVIIRIVANPLSNVFQKQLAQRTAHPLFIISATYGFLALACLPFGQQLKFSGLPTVFWATMLLVGLFAMLGNVFLVKALQIGDLSVLGPINAYKSIVGLVIGIFLLNEMPSMWGLVGVVLIVWGSYVVLTARTSIDHRRFSWRIIQQPEVKLRLAALVCSAVDGAFLKKAILLSTPMIAFFYWCLFGFAFTLIWVVFTLRHQWQRQAKLLVSQKFVYLALFLTVGITQVASNVALAHMQVGYALALFQTSALVSVLFGHHFFNEQGILRKLIGASIMVVGAILITTLG